MTELTRLNLGIDPSLLFFTSDQHFCHYKLLTKEGDVRKQYLINKYPSAADLTPEGLCDLMNDEIVRQHNEVVPPNGVVFCLGDFMLGNKRYPSSQGLLRALHGKKYLILGNHDDSKDSSGWEKVFPGEMTLRVKHISLKDPVYLFLSHYPHISWDRSHYGVRHLHGHEHGNVSIKIPHSFDVGVDSSLVLGLTRDHPFAPYSLAELISMLGTPNLVGNHECSSCR